MREKLNMQEKVKYQYQGKFRWKNKLNITCYSGVHRLKNLTYKIILVSIVDWKKRIFSFNKIYMKLKDTCFFKSTAQQSK